MIKTAILDELKFVVWDDNTPFYLTENDYLFLNFKSKTKNLKGAIVSLKNGLVRKDYTFYGEPLKVDKNLLDEGRIDCLVTLKDDLKTYYIDSFKVKILDQQYLLSSFFDSLTEKIQLIDERLSSLEKDKETIFD